MAKAKTPVKSKAKTKTQTKAKVSALVQYRNAAQTITVVSAVAYGVLWAIADVFGDNESSWLTATSAYLIGLTMIGGVTMGLLYALESSKK